MSSYFLRSSNGWRETITEQMILLLLNTGGEPIKTSVTLSAGISNTTNTHVFRAATAELYSSLLSSSVRNRIVGHKLAVFSRKIKRILAPLTVSSLQLIVYRIFNFQRRWKNVITQNNPH
jgi:hypothetical protein